MFREDVFRIALAEANKTQKKVAEECEMNETNFTRIKKGSAPNVFLAIKIARSINRKVEDLWIPDE